MPFIQLIVNVPQVLEYAAHPLLGKKIKDIEPEADSDIVLTSELAAGVSVRVHLLVYGGYTPFSSELGALRGSRESKRIGDKQTRFTGGRGHRLLLSSGDLSARQACRVARRGTCYRHHCQGLRMARRGQEVLGEGSSTSRQCGAGLSYTVETRHVLRRKHRLFLCAASTLKRAECRFR